jgi:hypothetical protein
LPLEEARRSLDSVFPDNAQYSTSSHHVAESMNCRTAESAYGGQNIEVKNIVLFLSRTSAVSAGGGFDIVLRTPHPAGGPPVSILKLPVPL